MSIYTFYLIIASLFQVAWLYNMKNIGKVPLKSITKATFWTANTFKAVFPIALYLLFGVGNITFLTFALKHVPASLAYAVWTGLVLTFASFIDRFYFGDKANPWQYFFVGLIAVGIIGLKISSQGM